MSDNWIEINTQEDLPDSDVFCWWVNRLNGSIHPSKLKSQLGRSLTHLTFSHYMVIKDVPTPPEERRQLQEQTSWTNFKVSDILRDKF